MLTIFSPPKPFHGHIGMIQRNAINSWVNLDPSVEVILVGDEDGIARTAEQVGAVHLPAVERNERQTPLVSSIFALAKHGARYSTLCYVNADVIFLDDLLPTIAKVKAEFERFLVVGQRWDLEVREPLTFDVGWEARLRKRLQRDGSLHLPAGSDYFVFSSDLFKQMPSFALGRAGWDNWMIYAGRAEGVPVIDATEAITIIHQDHDYGHLPGGQPHYRLPESDRNVELAGGRATIFTLEEADWHFVGGKLKRKPWTKRWGIRGLEARIVSRFGPGKVSSFTRALLHPMETLKTYRAAITRRISKSDFSPANGEKGVD